MSITSDDSLFAARLAKPLPGGFNLDLRSVSSVISRDLKLGKVGGGDNTI